MISSDEFELFRKLIYDHAGISLGPEKKIMVASRLSKRLSYYQLQNFRDYYNLATSRQYPSEFQVLVNILTTNETYFFREPKHFEFLQNTILQSWRQDNCRIWSAACSTGEETYTIAMVLAEKLGMRNWEVFGSDLSTRVLEAAIKGVYLMDRLDNMDPKYLNKYCLKGVREQSGFFRVDDRIRARTRFEQLNLMSNIPTSIGRFDVIFLRNVLIYFDFETKKAVVERVLKTLQPGGYFFISHAESMHGVTNQLKMVAPSVFIKK
jgi:chemotaxis protein methyltransferase CheR